jgi:L-glyceraldehyde 3-phosphate reductase
MAYSAQNGRYDEMQYRRCGRSGLKLSAVSLGLWHNFGGVDPFENGRAMVRKAFDLGVTHFDLANNYGPPAGSAEDTMGKILRADLGAYRDELVISTKAGYAMWPGPYGDFGSRKYLVSSLDQSLQRLGIPYVDIFYHHRPDPETPLEETMGALDHIVRSGKALYVGISSYGPAATAQAAKILRDMGTPCLIHQPSYNMLNRKAEEGLLEVLAEEGVGAIAFCPLAQGVLTGKYLEGIPEDSRVKQEHGFLKADAITDEKMAKVRLLNEMAQKRGQSLAQMALAWVLRHETVASVLIGASRPAQIEENVRCLQAGALSAEELSCIDGILSA